MEADARRLVVLRTANVAQLVLSRLLEPFDAKTVEVRRHREHFNMILLQTRDKIDGLSSDTYEDTVRRLPEE